MLQLKKNAGIVSRENSFRRTNAVYAFPQREKKCE
jgi:hypothetical protein